jgi:DNA-binding transcriptional ArsR family regulator
MNLLAEILSSEIRAEIFRILFGVSEAPLHVREIERRSGFAIGTVQQELRKLLRLDLVKKFKDGNRLYYRANRSHPLFGDIHLLVLKTNGLVDVLKEALENTRDLQSAFVFGSIAGQKESAESDVDLMVIGKIGLRKLVGLLVEPARIFGREINPHVLSLEEFIKRRSTKNHFLTRVLESFKIFVIGNEDELKRMGEPRLVKAP